MKHYIFNNYYNAAFENEVRNDLFQQYREEEQWGDVNSVPDERVWEEMNFLNDIYFDDAMHELKHFFEGKALLVCGDVGRWNGSRSAGKVIDVDELYKCWTDCDYISIYDEDGHLFIKASHHDGTNFWEVKILTETGCDKYANWYDSWNSSPTEEEIHNELWDNPAYTHIPHFAKIVYGCTTR